MSARMGRRGVVILSVVAGLASIPITAPAAQRPASNIAGTYSFQICAKRCERGDSAAAGYMGTLVLDTAALTFGVPNDTVPYLLRYADLFDPHTLPQNACFAQQWGSGSGEALADIFMAARMRWTTVRDSALGTAITFSMIRSTDAGYEIVAKQRGDILEGHGMGWDIGTVEKHQPRGYFIARRIGPPQPLICFNAGSAILARRNALHAISASRDSQRFMLAKAKPAVFAAIVSALVEHHFVIADTSAASGRIVTRPSNVGTFDKDVVRRGTTISVALRQIGDSTLVRVVADVRSARAVDGGEGAAVVVIGLQFDLLTRLGVCCTPVPRGDVLRAKPPR